MTGTSNEKLKKLLKLRRILAIAAAVLLISTVVLGCQCFSGGSRALPEGTQQSSAERGKDKPIQPEEMPDGQPRETEAPPPPADDDVKGDEGKDSLTDNGSPQGRPATNPEDNKPPENQEKPPEDQEKPPEDQEKPPEDQEKPPENQEKPPEDQEKPPENQEKPPENQEKPPENQEKPPENQEKPPAITPSQEQTPVTPAPPTGADAVSAFADPKEDFSKEGEQEQIQVLVEETTQSAASEEPPAQETAQTLTVEENGPGLLLRILFCISAALLAAVAAGLVIVSLEIRKLGKTAEKPAKPAKPVTAPAAPEAPGRTYELTRQMEKQSTWAMPEVGRAHNIGKRSYQQDCLGQIPVLNNQGLLAMVADGMGGLADGDKVSKRIIMKGLDIGSRMTGDNLQIKLLDMVGEINEDVNQMLGPDGLYKSGSTLVSVLLVQNRMWWISVGDSRIYLQRNGKLTQISRDHDLLQEWMPEIRSGRISYEEALADPNGRKLTSFIGMGKLRYIDRNTDPIQLASGDRILLMSDGIYGTVKEPEMVSILNSFPNVQEAAAEFERRVEAANLRHQDNYTIMIIGV